MSVCTFVPFLFVASDFGQTNQAAVLHSPLHVMLALDQGYIVFKKLAQCSRLSICIACCRHCCLTFYTRAGPVVFGTGLLPGYSASTAKVAASLILRLQLHDPRPPSDPTLSLPTPSNADWLVIESDACRALVAYHWYRHHPEACEFMGLGAHC